MSANPGVCVLVGRPTLARALSRLLSERLGAAVRVASTAEAQVPERVVLTTTVDCTVPRCASMAAEGKQLVVLAAMPSGSEKLGYLAAGAKAYVAMEVDAGPLVRAITDLLQR